MKPLIQLLIHAIDKNVTKIPNPRNIITFSWGKKANIHFNFDLLCLFATIWTSGDSYDIWTMHQSSATRRLMKPKLDHFVNFNKIIEILNIRKFAWDY